MNDSKNYAEGLDARQTPATKWRLHFTNQIQQDEDWMTKLTDQKEIQSYLERIKRNEDKANNWKSCISTAKPDYGQGPNGGKSGAIFPLNLRCICFQHGDDIYDRECICVDLLSGKPYRSIEKTCAGPGGSLASTYRQWVLSWQEFKKYAAYISAELSNFYRNIDDNNWQEHLIPKNVYFQVPITKEELEPQRDCGHKTIKSNEVTDSLQVTSNYKSRFNMNEVDISEMDTVFEKWQKQNNIVLNDNIVEKIKEEVRLSVEYIRNPDSKYVLYFYYSEYPMGAEHSKCIKRENGEWILRQYDYDKIPSFREIKLSSKNFVWDFIQFYHQTIDAKSTEEESKLMNENVTEKKFVKIPISDFKSLVMLRNPDYQEATNIGLPWFFYGLCRKNGMALKRISDIKNGVALYQEIEYSELKAASKKSRWDRLSGLTPQNWYEYCILREGDLLIFGSETNGDGPYRDETRYGLEVLEDGYFLICRSGGPMSGMFDHSKRLPIGFFADKTIDEIKSFIYDSADFILESLISVNDNELELLVETDKYRVGIKGLESRQLPITKQIPATKKSNGFITDAEL